MNSENLESVPNATVVQPVSEIENDLNVIIGELLEVNEKLKDIENHKSNLRLKFFELASKHISTTQTLAHQYIEGSFTIASAKRHIENYFPEWRLVKRNDEGILIEEDPDKMKFVWTTEDGIQCSRSIAMVGAKFDVDSFVSAQPELAKSVILEKTIYEFDETRAQEMIDNNPELLPVFQNFALVGKIQTKLSSPKIIEKEENK
jgi:hypothetical protein